MKNIWWISLFLLAGCGKNILGPSTDNDQVTTSTAAPTVIVYNYTQKLSSSLIRDVILWSHRNFGGLGGKNIEVYAYTRTSNVWGNATIGGETIKLYTKSGDDVVTNVRVLFHEIDHLRGKRESQLREESYYTELARQFLRR